VGLYGLVSYGVSRRTREIGIRMALGANRADVAALVTRQGVALVLVGIALGWSAAFFAARALASVLYGVEATDALTFGAAALSLVTVAFVANWIPARRAARIQPVSALRYE
jgi:putative ABC transport system permease protein